MRDGELKQADSRVPVYCRTACRVLSWAAIATTTLWALLALALFPDWPVAARVLAAVTWSGLAVAGVARLSGRQAAAAIVAGVVVIWLLWLSRRPSNERNWTPDQDRMPVAHFDDNRVTIEHVRQASYRNTQSYEVQWSTRTYDLNDIRTVDFVVEQFASWQGPAHTLLTFGFVDGRYLAISVEIRKEVGETFSALAGLFRRFEIMYVVGDERDLIGLRTHVRKNPVYLFPIKAKREHIRSLFVSMLQRANKLAEQPEFYNTLTNTCTTNIVRHLEQVSQRNVPWDVRVLLPGYSDQLAFELGLIEADAGLASARVDCLLPGPPDPPLDDPAWSARIRKRGQDSFLREGEAPAEPPRDA